MILDDTLTKLFWLTDRNVNLSCQEIYPNQLIKCRIVEFSSYDNQRIEMLLLVNDREIKVGFSRPSSFEQSDNKLIFDCDGIHYCFELIDDN